MGDSPSHHWRYAAPMTPSPDIHEDRSLLVFAADSEVIAFRRSDTHGGDVVWQSPHGLTLQSGPALGVPGNVRQGDEIGGH